jgi:hypothetical protein
VATERSTSPHLRRSSRPRKNSPWTAMMSSCGQRDHARRHHAGERRVRSARSRRRAQNVMPSPSPPSSRSSHKHVEGHESRASVPSHGQGLVQRHSLAAATPRLVATRAGSVHQMRPIIHADIAKKCARFCQRTRFASISRRYASLTRAVSCSAWPGRSRLMHRRAIRRSSSWTTGTSRSNASVSPRPRATCRSVGLGESIGIPAILRPRLR